MLGSVFIDNQFNYTPLTIVLTRWQTKMTRLMMREKFNRINKEGIQRRVRSTRKKTYQTLLVETFQ